MLISIKYTFMLISSVITYNNVHRTLLLQNAQMALTTAHRNDLYSSSERPL